jgi:N,N'-diacetyllegionaminate synthase
MTRPILIAECCQNHNGNREILKRMIHEAAAAGADYAKIQSIRSREIAFRERFETGAVDAQGQQQVIKRPYAAEVERLSKLDLTLEDEAWFVDECRRAGIASMTTIFTRAVAREVKDLGFTAVKIASYDCRSYPLLRDARRWWSTIVVSTGASLDAEIARAAEELRGTDFTMLHCVTIYPTPLEELHLRRMDWLRRFCPSVGFSDHTAPGPTGLTASKIAFAVGAQCIERHFTVLRPDETRDGPVSITPAQVRELRDFADRPRPERMEIVRKERPDWEIAIGKAQRPLSRAEWLNRDYYAGRFASKIGGRDVFNWEDVDIDALTAAQ